MKRQFCHAKFQKSNQKPIFISQNSIIMETDKCLFALIYIFQKLSGLIYLRNSFRFCVRIYTTPRNKILFVHTAQCCSLFYNSSFPRTGSKSYRRFFMLPRHYCLPPLHQIRSSDYSADPQDPVPDQGTNGSM